MCRPNAFDEVGVAVSESTLVRVPGGQRREGPTQAKPDAGGRRRPRRIDGSLHRRLLHACDAENGQIHEYDRRVEACDRSPLRPVGRRRPREPGVRSDPLARPPHPDTHVGWTGPHERRMGRLPQTRNAARNSSLESVTPASWDTFWRISNVRSRRGLAFFHSPGWARSGRRLRSPCVATGLWNHSSPIRSMATPADWSSNRTRQRSAVVRSEASMATPFANSTPVTSRPSPERS